MGAVTTLEMHIIFFLAWRIQLPACDAFLTQFRSHLMFDVMIFHLFTLIVMGVYV